ncbi:MAG: hypothetical protein P4L79_01655 [Legionella sp.]|uniref:hypothetical protein n=1 Tax=Legionella sp. TaxID=459 RepID=UPI00283E644B|nr:hypothetical protein [Legionella sp.]
MPLINKASFFQGDKTSYQLKASDLKSIVEYYSQKDISILVNGANSDFPKDTAIMAMQSEIDSLKDANKKYGVYFKRRWPGNQDSMLAPLYAFFNEEKLSWSSSPEAFYQAAQKFWFFGVIQQNIDENIEKLVALLEERIKAGDVWMNKAQAIEEMKQIQASLASEQTMGYFFTNGHASGKGHFEVFIITSDAIIKPVQWSHTDVRKEIVPQDLPTMCYTPSTSPVIFLPQSKWPFTLPQSQRLECGTLGILYLKELLKNDAKQLKELTLRFPHFNAVNGQWEYFFFPSPQVLRYSQSGFYNRVIQALLSDSDDLVECSIDGTSVKYNSLKRILKHSIQYFKGSPEETAQMQLLLDGLPAFRERWLEEFAKADQTRETMTKDSLNHYLAYRSRNMEALSNLTLR